MFPNIKIARFIDLLLFRGLIVNQMTEQLFVLPSQVDSSARQTISNSEVNYTNIIWVLIIHLCLKNFLVKVCIQYFYTDAY